MKQKICMALALSLLIAVAPVAAQSYPSKPVRLILPYPPGGGTDLVARPLAQRLAERLGQQVIVDNRGGANGAIGMEVAARAPADGHTLVLALTAQLAINPAFYRKLSYDPVRDYTPVSLIGTSPYLLSVHPSLPVKTVRDLIVLAQNRPGQLAFASSGTGGIPHLAGEMLKSMAGVDMLHVPYKGGGPGLADLIAGHVQLNFAVIPVVLPHVRGGRLRALAVTSEKRSSVIPDVAAVAEALRGYEASTWFAVLAPGGTPDVIVNRLASEIVSALAMPDLRQQLPPGFEPVGSTPAQLGDYIRSEITKWAKVVKASGIKPE